VEASAGENSYSGWRSAVDERLQEIYCITVEGAGFDEDYLTHHWQSGEPAIEFVEWFGNKYDLEPVGSFIRFHSRDK
jgi:hypothetical protein